MKQIRFSIVGTLKFAFCAILEHFFFFFSVFFTWLITMGFGLAVLGVVLLYPMRGTITVLFSHVHKLEKTVFTRMMLDTLSLGISGIIFIFCAFALYHFLQFGLIRIAFDIHDRDSSSVSELFSAGWLVLLKGLAISFLYYIMVFGGLLLFVIPGIIAAVTFNLAIYVLIDKKCGVLEALKESAHLTKGIRKHIFGLLLILGAIVQLSLGSGGLGYIIVWPVSMLAGVYLYRKLQATATATATTATVSV